MQITYDPATLLAIADQNIEMRNWPSAWAVINGIIHEFPQYGPAYNHKGWLCANVMYADREAEDNFNIALKYAPEYHPTYVNYASLLNRLNRFEELEELLKKALEVESIDKVKLYNEWGLLQEKKGQFDAAIVSYLESIKYSVQNDEIAVLNDSVIRCKNKQKILFE